jgi:hypothetical protein
MRGRQAGPYVGVGPSRATSIIDYQVRRACSQCNNGSMSDLEQAASATVEAMIEVDWSA